MDRELVEKVADEVITRPGFKKMVSGEIARQLKESKPKKEKATSKKAGSRTKATQ